MAGQGMSRAQRAFLQGVEGAGGRWDRSADGHVKVFSRTGRFVVKLRAGGKRVGDSNATERRLHEQFLRRVREED